MGKQSEEERGLQEQWNDFYFAWVWSLRKETQKDNDRHKCEQKLDLWSAGRFLLSKVNNLLHLWTFSVTWLQFPDLSKKKE